jgi:hypothetical protein
MLMALPSKSMTFLSIPAHKSPEILVCQGTPAAVLMQANIYTNTLNKGGSSDPGTQSAVGRTA